ncbi:hypothetical protein NMG60_11036796 [Bertholletia excelsa]
MRNKCIGGRPRRFLLPPQPSAMAFSYLGESPQFSNSEAHPDCTSTDNKSNTNDPCNIVVPETSSGSDKNRQCHDFSPSINGKVVAVTNKCSAPSPRGISGEDYCLEMDWTEKKLCIKCDKGGKVLVCSDSSCPLAVHEECMHCVAQLDSMGNFYCPYCLYKQAMMETHKAREKAMLAKRALAAFLDGGMMDGDLEKQKATRDCRKEPSPSTVARDREYDKTQNTSDVNGIENHHILVEEVQHGETFKPRCNTSFQQNDGGGVSGREKDKENQLETLQVGESIRVGFPRLVNDCQNMRVVQNAKPLNMFCAEEETMMDGMLHLPTERVLEKPEIEKEEENSRLHEEEMQGQEHETTVPSRRGDSLEQEHERANQAVSSNGKPVKRKIRKVIKPSKNGHLGQSPRKSSFELNTNEVHMKKEISAKKSRQRLTTPTSANVKRRKLWTAEEEEMLKEGVQKYSSTVNKNIPWRKILEFGCHVFDISRTPADLKDKWRNSLVKSAK